MIYNEFANSSDERCVICINLKKYQYHIYCVKHVRSYCIGVPVLPFPSLYEGEPETYMN